MVTVSVTAEDGVTVMNYVVVVRRGLPSVEARLADLLVSTGNMTPAFSPDVYLYSLGPLRYDQNTVQVTPVAMDPDHERILVNDARQPSGSISRQIEIEEGYGNGADHLGNGTVEVMVWAENGMTFKTYRILVTRQPAPISDNDATLRELRISPSATTGLIPSFSLQFDYRLSCPTESHRGSHASFQRRRCLSGVRNDDDVGSGGTFITTMADLLPGRTLDIEVRAKSCGPTYQPAECVRNHYKVEVLSMDPGRTMACFTRCLATWSTPAAQCRSSCSQCHSKILKGFGVSFKLRLSEYDMGKKSVRQGFCDNYLCVNS